eukprot:6210414-Pleurochrysis_carterae.AAC.5
MQQVQDAVTELHCGRAIQLTSAQRVGLSVEVRSHHRQPRRIAPLYALTLSCLSPVHPYVHPANNHLEWSAAGVHAIKSGWQTSESLSMQVKVLQPSVHASGGTSIHKRGPAPPYPHGHVCLLNALCHSAHRWNRVRRLLRRRTTCFLRLCCLSSPLLLRCWCHRPRCGHSQLAQKPCAPAPLVTWNTLAHESAQFQRRIMI